MDFVQLYGKEIVALAVPFIAWTLNRFFKAKARLRYASPHAFIFVADQPLTDKDGTVIAPKQTVHTRSILIRNEGSDPASNVEIVFNWKPQFMNVWPPRRYKEETAAHDRHSIVFESVAPNEIVGCEVMSVNVELPHLVNVRCDEGPAEKIEMQPAKVISKSWRIALSGLLLLGMAAAVYLMLLLMQFLVLKTPYGH